ncbi:MAG: PHP domain-containing protein [Pseudomonadota bacterium]
MKIDLHIHSNYSDGRMTPAQIFESAVQSRVSVLSITDHDSIDGQEEAKTLSAKFEIEYIHGLELNVSFSHLDYREGKPASLDFLAYDFDIHDGPLTRKLMELRDYREKRAEKILEKINHELLKENLKLFTRKDLAEIQNSVDGAFGRPHIANYMVKKGIVASKQEAFDRYLVKCNVPKMPLSLPEASDLVRGAGGKLMLAHPNHPRGTSLAPFTQDLAMQQGIIREAMLQYIDGIECWHSRHNALSTRSYLDFARKSGLMVTGGSDCHQQPVLIGTVEVPEFVMEQFGIFARPDSKNRQIGNPHFKGAPP